VKLIEKQKECLTAEDMRAENQLLSWNVLLVIKRMITETLFQRNRKPKLDLFIMGKEYKDGKKHYSYTSKEK
jgi:hypothetical protein